MPGVDALCFLVSRLTPHQRHVLAEFASLMGVLPMTSQRQAMWWDIGDTPERDSVVTGLCRLGLLEQHPTMHLLYRITPLGFSVLEVLTDTGVR
jgi:hypothetical protein